LADASAPRAVLATHMQPRSSVTRAT
jgi:hypothetical protein